MIIKKKNIIVLSVLASLLIIAGIGGLRLIQADSEAIPIAQKKSDAPSSMFEFTGAEGWRKGPNNATSMVLFNSNNPAEKSPCFTSAEYRRGTIDIDAEINKDRQILIDDGYDVTPLDTEVLRIMTSAGPKEYELHQSKIASPEGLSKIQEGKAIGYLPLQEGYLKTYSICEKSEDLPRTFTALEAIKLSVN